MTQTGTAVAKQMTSTQEKCLNGQQEQRLTALMLRALDEGDREAYETVLGELVPIITAFFSEKTASIPNDLEKLVQDTLVAVHVRRHTYCRGRSFFLWIYAIAGYKLATHDKGRRHVFWRPLSDMTLSR